MPEPVVLIGGGGHCVSCIEVLEASGFSIAGIIDHEAKDIFQYKYLGGDEVIQQFVGNNMFLITVGQVKTPAARMKLYSLVKDAGGSLPVIVASSAIVSTHAAIGEGTIVMHHGVVNAGSDIGVNCIINTKALVEHDCTIGDHVHVSTSAIVNGGCNIGSRVFIGSNSVLAHGVSIADDVTIGAGSVVIKNITAPGVYAGNPAKRISK